ncbi:MAG: putative ATPase [Gemmataceae bacterium]|nr:putative ATPase [Gemmataceae bacterium]
MPAAQTIRTPIPAAGPRAAAFCTPAGPDVFSGVVHGNQVWSPDPFDVETVHADARDEFARLLARASALDPPAFGKSLLLLGEAGSGKTHLMRAFRTAAHADGTGYCGYFQLRSRTDNYARYVLSNLITSLEQPYQPGLPDTGLNRLARGLLDALDVLPLEDRQRLTDDLLDPAEMAGLVHRFADCAVQYPQFRGIDVNVIRAVLYTLPNDGRIRPRILNWLRCEDLSRYDRELIGDLVPRPQPEKPMETIVDLGRLMHAAGSAALVLLADQIDVALELDRKDEDQGEQFRSAIGTLLEVSDKLPTAVVVVGCLEDLFTLGRQKLPGWMLDRLMHDPEPVKLAGKPSREQIGTIIGRRLEYLYQAFGVLTDPSSPTAPYTSADLNLLNGMQTRVILEHCLLHRRECIQAGTLVPFAPGTVVVPPPSQSDWEQRWNEYRNGNQKTILGDEPYLAGLLAFAVRTASAEMPGGVHFGADPDGRFVSVEVHGAGNAVDKLYVAVCDKSTRGGGLGKQFEEVARKAGEIPAVLVRSTAFPSTPGTQVVQEMVKLVAPRGKGRKVVVSDSDWRAMAAFREFHTRHHTDPGFADWQRTDRPLSELPAVHAVLALDKLLSAPPARTPAPPAPPAPPAGLPKPTAVPPSPPPPADPTAVVRLGQTRGSLFAAVEFRPADFRRHAAFLGGSGSGKTTAALTVVEQLLLAGVPAVLLDRKGDLARYADPDAWTDPEPDPDRAARRARLRAAVDVALFTPGAADGRPLAIPVVPPDLAALPAADREQLARYAAAGLGLMMGYKGKAPDPKVVILQKAIELLAAAPGRPVTVRGLQELVRDRDDALTAAFEGYEDRHYRKLGEDLLTVAALHRGLLEDGDPLDVDALLGRGSSVVPGRTRLTVINTQFLGDAGTTDFWVAQFLLAMDRWRAKSPAPEGALQAVFLFDEADQYLPAVGKPATKGPMEGLLKRARSAGVGVFLATQSPGDFDYKCRDQVLTWLIGRVKEPVAINKLKPMLAGRPDAAAKLAGQAAGDFFLVRESDVSTVRVDRNLIPTAQLPVDRILALARGQRPGGAHGPKL